jgi:hypothetical protein
MGKKEEDRGLVPASETFVRVRGNLCGIGSSEGRFGLNSRLGTEISVSMGSYHVIQ